MLLHGITCLTDRRTKPLLGDALEAAGVAVTDVAAPGDLLDSIRGRTVDFVMFSVDRGIRVDALLATLAEHPDRPAVFPVVDREDPSQRAELLSRGCFAVLNRDLPQALLRTTVTALMVRLRRQREKDWTGGPATPSAASSPADLEPRSPAMRELLEVAGRVATADSSLLLLGETGVGKEWVARRIHRDSARARRPFVAVNCAALPAQLLESELYGHVKGAFTGAVRSRRGLFELAHGGTLFLDEIGEMRPDLQGKLLRAIQDLRVRRVGSEEEIEVDVRLMAATSRDLDRARIDGSFRSDLYYRLAVVTLRVPPLKERRDDIPQLAEAYLDHYRRKVGRPDRRLTSGLLEALLRYAWPGNVRELINVIERAVVLSTRPTLDASDLPAEIRGARAAPAVESGSAGQTESPPVPPLDEWLDLPLRSARRRAIDWFERHYLEASLRAEGGRIGETASRIGVDPRSLYERMKHHDLRKEDFR